MLKHLFFTLFTCITFVSCVNGTPQNPTFPIGVKSDAITGKKLFYYEVSDTAFIYKTKDMQHERWWTKPRDTVIRFFPVDFLNAKGILLAKIKNGVVERYDLVLDDYSKWKYPFLKLTGQELRDKYSSNDSFWIKYVNRKQSSLKEFESLRISLTTQFGEPDEFGKGLDSSSLWKKIGIVLRLENNKSTSIISFISPSSGVVVDDRDWQFSNVVSDSFLSGLKLGSKRGNLITNIELRDTNISGVDSENEIFSVGSKKCWGILGKLTLVFDKNNDTLKRVVWKSFGTGHYLFEAAFMACAVELNKIIRKTHPVYEHSETNVKQIQSWSNDRESIVLVYYDAKEFLFFKGSHEFAKNLKE